MAAPFALFVFPLDESGLIPILAISFFVHVAYEWFMAASYTKGAFTLVYPVARGTAPAITSLIAILVFHETLASVQWIGILLLSGAIVALAGVNLREQQLDDAIKAALLPSVFLAIGAGICVSLYTIVDAYGIRLAVNPFTFLVWFFFLGGLGFPLVALARWRNMEVKPPIRPLIVRGFTGACVALFSFGTLMLATRIGKVSEAAALRETSILFAAVIGVLFLGEKLSVGKGVIIGLIALGALLIELG